VPDPLAITDSAVESAVDAALAAIAAAADTAALKAAKSAHAGEASPLAGLNALLRDVPADQKAAADRIREMAMSAVKQMQGGRLDRVENL